MTKSEFESLGLTVDQYKDEMGEEPIIDDTEIAAEEQPVTEDVQATVEEPVIEDAEVTSVTEPTVEDTVAAIVPTEEKAQIAVAGAALEFKNIKAAAEYLAEKLSLKVTNALDCLYKAKRSGSNKTHKYAVEYRADKTVALTPIA